VDLGRPGFFYDLSQKNGSGLMRAHQLQTASIIALFCIAPGDFGTLPPLSSVHHYVVVWPTQTLSCRSAPSERRCIRPTPTGQRHTKQRGSTSISLARFPPIEAYALPKKMTMYAEASAGGQPRVIGEGGAYRTTG
jgi:hypothetical protein